jgi:hypothetical protein
MRPDKPKVVDEVWDDDRIRQFLDKPPLGANVDADFSVLLFAYRSMRVEDFRSFIGFFNESGRNIDATDENGSSLLELIAGHTKAEPFREILRSAGAQ